MTSKDTDAKKQESQRHIDKAAAGQTERTTTIQNDRQSIGQQGTQTDGQAARQTVRWADK